ncbi:MAG: T9SS type A sorting domain-containing protein [Bacteroidota bacterium]
MGKNRLFAVITLIALFTADYTFAQINGSMTDYGNGFMGYDFTTPNNHNDLVFILYGDGSFGYGHSTFHQYSFNPNQPDYTMTAFSAKKNDTNVPDRMIINTGSIPQGSGSGFFVNPQVWMPTPVEIKTSWSPAPNHENYFIVSFKNPTSLPIASGRVELNYNGSDVTVNTGGILLYDNAASVSVNFPFNPAFTDVMAWSFNNLEPYETRHIYVPATVNGATGSLIGMSVKMTSTSQAFDPVVSSPRFFVRRYPHDPNFKIVDKECLAYGVPSGQKLNYTIGFFNDGNYYANNVYIRDELSQYLMGPTVNVLNYEHPPAWAENNQMLDMTFAGIMLPGINQNNGQTFYSYSDASSYVTFSVCTADNLYNTDEGGCISNVAEIQFDNQQIYQTEPATVCLEEQCQVYDPDCPAESDTGDGTIGIAPPPSPPSTEAASPLSVSPNPTSGDINVIVDFKEAPKNGFSLEVLDNYGVQVKQLTDQENANAYFMDKFNLSDLPKGVYVIVLRAEESVYFEKLIKQ